MATISYYLLYIFGAIDISRFYKVPNFYKFTVLVLLFFLFDVVFNEGVIEHYSLSNKPNYIDALREMIRVTKKNGKTIIAVPNWYNFPHALHKWTLNKLGKRFIYGYEKSFKHLELKKLFSDLGLEEIEVSGFYPSHGFYRLSGKKIRKIYYFLGKFTDILLKYPDKITNNYFTKRFGFEIVTKGVKS